MIVCIIVMLLLLPQVAFAEGYTAHDKKEVDGASLWVRRLVRLAWYGLFVWLLLQIVQSYGAMGGSEYSTE